MSDWEENRQEKGNILHNYWSKKLGSGYDVIANWSKAFEIIYPLVSVGQKKEGDFGRSDSAVIISDLIDNPYHFGRRVTPCPKSNHSCTGPEFAPALQLRVNTNYYLCHIIIISELLQLRNNYTYWWIIDNQKLS